MKSHDAYTGAAEQSLQQVLRLLDKNWQGLLCRLPGLPGRPLQVSQVARRCPSYKHKTEGRLPWSIRCRRFPDRA